MSPFAVHNAKRKKCQPGSRQVFGVELLTSSEVRVNGRSFSTGEGFIQTVSNGATAWKLPHANIVYIELKSGHIIAWHYSANSGRWVEASRHLVPANRRAALPSFSLLLWISEFFTAYRKIACWLPMPREFVLSESLKFVSGGLVAFERPDGTQAAQKIETLSGKPQELILRGVAGQRVIRGIGGARFNVERVGTRCKERFKYDCTNDKAYRHAHATPLAAGETDDFGVTYLKSGEVAFSQVAIPFKLCAASTPWSVTLPSGATVACKHRGYLLITDANRNLHERFRQPNGQWHAIETGMWEVKTAWVLNAEKQLSVKVLDVLELFADGQVCFLNQYQYPDGVEIDVRCQGLHLIRDAGSSWLELYEAGQLIGSGCYSLKAFTDREGETHAGWSWGAEADLPLADDGHMPFIMPWAAVLIFVFFLCDPVGVGTLLLLEIGFGLAFIVALIFVPIWIGDLWQCIKPFVVALDRPASSFLVRLVRLFKWR